MRVKRSPSLTDSHQAQAATILDYRRQTKDFKVDIFKKEEETERQPGIFEHTERFYSSIRI